MQDISCVLNMIMQKENCSSIRAFFLLAENGEDEYELRSVQSESSKKTGGRLRDKSNF